jgi:hypothetical protein
MSRAVVLRVHLVVLGLIPVQVLRMLQGKVDAEKQTPLMHHQA